MFLKQAIDKMNDNTKRAIENHKAQLAAQIEAENKFNQEQKLMTRDEAVKIYNDKMHNINHVVDMYIALGMLKIEKEKTIEEKVVDLFSDKDYIPKQFLQKLDQAGFKIVEK